MAADVLSFTTETGTRDGARFRRRGAKVDGQLPD